MNIDKMYEMMMDGLSKSGVVLDEAADNRLISDIPEDIMSSINIFGSYFMALSGMTPNDESGIRISKVVFGCLEKLYLAGMNAGIEKQKNKEIGESN